MIPQNHHLKHSANRCKAVGIITRRKRRCERIIRAAMAMDELGYLILQMARLNRLLWTKQSAYSTALAALLEWHEHGNSPSRAQVQQAIADGEKAATETIDPELEKLEQALLDGTEFRSALRAYLDKHK